MDPNSRSFNPAYTARQQQQQPQEFGSYYYDQVAPNAVPYHPEEYYDPTEDAGGTGYTHYHEPLSSAAAAFAQEDPSTSWIEGVPPDEPVLPETTPESGYYCFVNAMQVHGNGDPITAVAYDPTYAAVYLATPSLALSSAGRARHHFQPPNHNHHPNHPNKASKLLVHSTLDHTLYSSVAGHPEAPAQVLNSIYKTVYGGIPPHSPASLLMVDTQPTTSRHIPSHAYRPPYGSLDPVLSSTLYTSPTSSYQRGVETLLPLAGYVASISPAGVRLHQCGGFLEADHPVQGMLCGTVHPTGVSNGPESPALTTHITVGGLDWTSTTPSTNNAKASNHRHSHGGAASTPKHHLHCLDLWQGLRTVASYSLHSSSSSSSRTTRLTPSSHNSALAVTALATLHSNGSMVAGCTDGQLRLLDIRLRDMATIKSHTGGIVNVAASPDGTLIATTGYGARGTSTGSTKQQTSSLYSFPDPSILVYDIRYLGRGGVPHPFAGVRGGPRFLSFIPDVHGQPCNRLVAASGQVGGGLQILVPFQEALDNPAGYVLPPLEQGGSITSMCVSQDDLALGTSFGTLLQYRLAGYEFDCTLAMGPVGTSSTKFGAFGASSPLTISETTRQAASSIRPKKHPLQMPFMQPSPPALSLDASLLISGDKDGRSGATDPIKSIMSAYVLARDPKVSFIGSAKDASKTSYCHLAAQAMVAPCRLNVAASLLHKASEEVDFLRTVATSKLDVNLMEDHRDERTKSRSTELILPNPNKILHTGKLFSLCYEEGVNRTNSKTVGRRRQGAASFVDLDDDDDDDDTAVVPARYRLTKRPSHKSAAAFNYPEFNETGYLPGWDYSPTMPNAFVPPVLMLFYLLPELRRAATSANCLQNSSPANSIISDLGFLFHRIDSLGRFALLFPASGSPIKANVGAWAPTNFISGLVSMPEAEQLQILDGSPAAVDPPRRPEAFYRFLLYQVEKEAGKQRPSARSLDSVCGMDFVSINEFVSGSDLPTTSPTRVLTVDLFYDGLDLNNQEGPASTIRFGDILRRTLCREARLRAWSQGSKSYETIVQRKIATSLPSILSLSCACAGRKEAEGLECWRREMDDNRNWLPELIEVELVESGVAVREFVPGAGGSTGRWVDCQGSGSNQSFPPSVAGIVSQLTSERQMRKRRYRLDAVLSIVRDDFDKSAPVVRSPAGEGTVGHLVLHARVTSAFKENMLQEQVKHLEDLLTKGVASPFTLLGQVDESWTDRLVSAKAKLAALQADEGQVDEWVLINGFVVSNADIGDATAFHAKFKEPSILVYRAIDAELGSETSLIDSITLPPDVMKTNSLNNGAKSLLVANQWLHVLPGEGDLVAFDAEFVSVQEEESTLSESGSKLVVRETRYAVARISVIDCRTDSVVVDDYVLPRERVVDCLTRFSGIVPSDLDPKQSPHHLIDARSAYLKLRHLLERGCIFVGHGLQQDFWTVNLAVPPSQIIDTVELYHKPAQRYVSLRFLTNFVLKRDMQQEVHDSVEDAMAAHELYRRAVELKLDGSFDRVLDELYEYGQKNDWKLGVDDDEPQESG